MQIQREKGELQKELEELRTNAEVKRGEIEKLEKELRQLKDKFVHSTNKGQAKAKEGDELLKDDDDKQEKVEVVDLKNEKEEDLKDQNKDCQVEGEEQALKRVEDQDSELASSPERSGKLVLLLPKFSWFLIFFIFRSFSRGG